MAFEPSRFQAIGIALSSLALPPGYRFLIAPGHEDVWTILIRDGNSVRILFEDEQRRRFSARISLATFSLIVRGFLAWISQEGENVGDR